MFCPVFLLASIQVLPFQVEMSLTVTQTSVKPNLVRMVPPVPQLRDLIPAHVNLVTMDTCVMSSGIIVKMAISVLEILCVLVPAIAMTASVG